MKITFNSPVILTFTFLCAGAFLLSNLMHIGQDLFLLFPNWQFDSPLWYFRLFSNTLGHSDGDHLMGNLAFIVLLGPIVEERYGAKQTLLIILSTALVSSLIHILVSNAALLGASGIVFALILVASLVNFKKGEIPLTFILIVLIFIGKEVMGLFADDSISHTTHIVGGLVGGVFGFTLGKN